MGGRRLARRSGFRLLSAACLWALPQSHGAAIVAARDAAVARLTRNAVQLRKAFYQASRPAAGLLVVVFAMTGAAKLADQIVTWLTFAVWQPFTIADALRFWDIPVPRAPQLLGLAQLTDAVLSWPGILAYLLLAGACLFMFARIDRGLGRLSRKSAGAHPQRRFDVIAGTSAVRRTTEVARK
jgi:hypothetical protein